MRINKIKPVDLKFTSNNIINNFGFDDSISQEKRTFLRENILEKSMPFYNVFENSKRLEKYELQKLICSLCGYKLNQDSLQNIFKNLHQTQITNENISNPMPTESVSNELIENLPLFNLDLVSKKFDVYRGESLQGNFNALKTLKNAGIERIVDLIGYENLKEDCNVLGLDYFKYPMSPYLFMQNDMFKSEEECKQKFLNHCRGFGENEKTTKIYITKMMNIWQKNKDLEIDKFVKFIQTMQKGKLYIGCEYGTYTTDNALMLNAFFNPAYIRQKRYITSNNRIYLKRLEKLYKNFSPQHKQAMGWNSEFEKKVIERLKLALNF